MIRLSLLYLRAYSKYCLSSGKVFQFANFIHFIIHFYFSEYCGTSRICIFCLFIFSPTCHMDCNKQLHIKVSGPPVELRTGSLVVVIHTGFKQEQKQVLFVAPCESHRFSEYLGYSYSIELVFLCESSPTSRDGYTQPLAHDTERLVNYDWAIHTLFYIISIFSHIYIY